MQSKNKKKPTKSEREHIDLVKSLPCSLCDAPGPTEAHEINQGFWFTSVALCPECHRDPIMGWHGQKRAWAIYKMDMIKALNVTVRRLMA